MFAVAIVAVAAVAIVAISHDEVARLRAIEAKAGPVPAAVQRALLTTDPVLFDRPRPSLLWLRGVCAPGRVIACGATTQLLLARMVTKSRRMLRWHLETAVVGAVISYTFTGDEVLRIYANEAYFGSIEGAPVVGVERASQAYFGKQSRDLSHAEAAMLVGILPSPNSLSPFDAPARALERRNGVLRNMHRLGYITQREYESSVAEAGPARRAG